MLTEGSAQEIGSEFMAFRARVDKLRQICCGARDCGAAVATLELNDEIRFVPGFGQDPADGIWRLTPRASKQWQRARSRRVPWQQFIAKGRLSIEDGPGEPSARRRYVPELASGIAPKSELSIVHFECPINDEFPHLNEHDRTVDSPEEGTFSKQESYVDMIRRLRSLRPLS